MRNRLGLARASCLAVDPFEIERYDQVNTVWLCIGGGTHPRSRLLLYTFLQQQGPCVRPIAGQI